MKRPILPLPSDVREVVDFCLYFRTVEGFIAEYRKNFMLISRGPKKKGLRTAAYEMTEQFYCQLFNVRRYTDRESFFNALSIHNARNGKK